MSSIILELFESLKICIPIALLTSLFFGYLYTKLQARETYHPMIKEFTKNINQHTKGFKNAEKEHQKLNGEIEYYEYKLKEINKSIFEYKESFASKKDVEMEMLHRERELKSKYEEKQSILSHYNGEIENVKKECRLDDVANIAENTESMNRLIVEKEQLLKEKHNKFSMIQHKVKGLEVENGRLEEKVQELDKNSKDMVLKVIEKGKELNDLEKDFLKEYDLLYEKNSLSHERVKEYKEKLIKLKSL
jgi:septal ring factor EnvC (AmiA/AmiB activator)